MERSAKKGKRVIKMEDEKYFKWKKLFYKKSSKN